jgi:hypothetical protein
VIATFTQHGIDDREADKLWLKGQRADAVVVPLVHHVSKRVGSFNWPHS